MTRLMTCLAATMVVCSAALAAKTHEVSPGQSIQKVLDAASEGDVIVLGDGMYHESLEVRKAVTIKAAHGGEATVTNRHEGKVTWVRSDTDAKVWTAAGVDWPVQRMLIAGVHAFDYRTKENFLARDCGPFWSKGWQTPKKPYTTPPISFAHDAEGKQLWLRMDDDRDPNKLTIDFNSSRLDGKTLVQKDLGTYWNQQQIVVLSKNPPEYPTTMWYNGTEKEPAEGKRIDFPKGCGIVININADNVTLQGLRILMAPTVGVEVNNSHNVTIRDCYFSGYQFAINTGYECTRLTVEQCEMDGGRMVSYGGNKDETNNMWNHSTYVNPIKFNGTGLTFRHNYVYEGYDLFHPRGRHKNFPNVPDLRSDVGYNVWQANCDNALEFDAVEARMNLRAHHNLIIARHDPIAITTTEDGGPLTIDHNLIWGQPFRLMKLNGTKRTNRGVQFVHNTYFAGATASAALFERSVFENNVMISSCKKAGAWSVETLGAFFPTKYNLLKDGQQYTAGFEGITDDPKLGDKPDTFFLLQEGSPAINAGVVNKDYYQDNVSDGKPDLGAIEYGKTVDDWRKEFGHVGPAWITAKDAAQKAPHRPVWPGELDKRWGGLDD
jgi:hypothetical protein